MARVPRMLWRIIDANANRAMEGLRAAEEFVRFGWNAPALTRRCRRLRHGVARAVSQLPGADQRLLARDTRRDVGRRAAPRRTRWTALLTDNIQRTKEALRVLEECARAVAPTAARTFQRLRFDAYDLEQQLDRRLATLRHPGRRSTRSPRRAGGRPRRH